jgi:hypothetical protein
MIKIERNPDGSIKAAYSVDASGMRLRGMDPTPIPVLGSMPQSTMPSLDSILGNVKVDPITGKFGKRTFDEFKDFIKINKEGFLRDEGKFEGFQGGGMKSFNIILDDLQEGKRAKLTEEEAKYVDDLKNNSRQR